jgi:copper homeostasis protein
MARPRAGDFCYEASEFDVLLRDASLLLDHGADGVAFGVLTADARIDLKRCRKVMGVIKAGAVAVFHRAFDRVRDPVVALEQLIDLGVHRVMTSGQQPTALRGAGLIARLVERAAGRIEVLPAGGVRPSNARRILSQTRCAQLHSSLRERGGTRMSREILSELIDELDTWGEI